MRPPAGNISLAQAARLSGYHQDYLGQLCRAGKLSATKIGRTWFTTESAVRDFLRSLQGSSAPAASTKEQPQPELERKVIEASASSSGPHVVENVVISEVVGLPIALRAKPLTPRIASLDSVITRVRLERVQRDLAQLTEVVQEIADQVESQANIIERLQTGSAMLKHSYAPSLEATVTPNLQTLARPENQFSEPEPVSPLQQRVLIVSAGLLAIALAFLFATNYTWQSKFFGDPEIATQTILLEKEPAVAGDTVIVPATVSGPLPTVTNSNANIDQVPPPPTSPDKALGGVDAGNLLQ